MPRVTLSDRCLLHVLDRTGLGPEPMASEELLQNRIAVALRAQRAHVARAMKKLAKRGLVEETKFRASGEARRRIAYVLTESGVRVARQVRENVESMEVVVIGLDGSEAVRRLHEVQGLLPRRVRFSDVVGAVRGGRLDLRELQERPPTVHRGRVHDVRETVVLPKLYGRDATLARLRAFLGMPRVSGFLLMGLPGIGKTAVASWWVQSLRGRYHVLWRRTVGASVAELLRDLAALLRTAGRPALWDRLHRPSEGAQEDLRILRRDLAGLPVVLVFDDAHAAAGADLQALLTQLLHVEGEQTPKVLFVAREIPAFLGAEDVARDRVWVQTLDDLARPDAELFLEGMGVERARREAILRSVGGHPMSLELAGRGGLTPDEVHRRSAAWLAEAALSRLEPAELEALAFAAVFEGPVSSAVVGPTVHELLNRCLLREVGDGRLGVHDLVRDAVLRDLPAERLSELRHSAGETLARSRDPGDALAALRQFVAAGSYRAAEDLASVRGPEVIVAGLAGPLVPLVEQLAWTARESGEAPSMSLLLGHALSALGRWREASAAYAACEDARDPRVAAEGALGRGKAELQRRSKLALPTLTEARDRLEGLGALRLLAEAQYWIGCIHENEGRWEDARESFEKGRAIALDVGERRWEGMCTYALGRIRSARKEFVAAIKEEAEALRLLEREGHRLEVAKVCTGLGGNLYELGRLEEATEYLDRAVREARETGATGVLGTALYNQAATRAKAGHFREALPFLEESERLYESQEQFEKAAQCAAWHAAYASKSDLAEVARASFERAERLLERSRAPGLRARALREIADAERQAGRAGAARRHLRLATEDARRAGSVELAAQLLRERRSGATRSYRSRARTSRTPARPRTRRRRGTRTKRRTTAP